MFCSILVHSLCFVQIFVIVQGYHYNKEFQLKSKRSANISDFLRKDEWDIPGNDVSHSTIYAPDYAGCSVKCQKTSGCKAFAYSPSTGQCWPKTSTGDGGKSNGDRISGYSSNMCGGFVRKDEWDIPGNDILPSPVQVPDYAGCCIECQATSGCKAFAYSPSTGQCWPKTSTGDGGYSNSDRISGYSVNTFIYTHGIYTLAFVDEDNRMSATTRQGIIDTFFASYPQMCERFNSHSCARNVRMTIDPNYDGIAYVSSNGIVIGPWISNSPGGDDVVVHEAMHVVQSYPRYDPGWLVEGIADYSRWKFRVNDPVFGFLYDYERSQHYTNAYRVTARFLAWCEKFYPNIVNDLDRSMRDNTYSMDSWKQFAAGKTVDQLWIEYSNNPDL